MSDNANTNDQDPRPEYHEIPADHILEVSPYLPLDRSQEHGNDSATRLDPTSIQQNEASIASATESSVYAGGSTLYRPFAGSDGLPRPGTSEPSITGSNDLTQETESATASYESGGSNDNRPLPDGDASPTPCSGALRCSSVDPSYGWDTVEVIPIREVENSGIGERLADHNIWACDLCDTPIRDGQVTGNSAICSDCIRKSLAK